MSVQKKEVQQINEVGSKLGMQWRDGTSAEVGSTYRIQQLNKLLHVNRPNLEIHRTRCFTKVFKATEGQPFLRRRYLASAETYATLPVQIYNHERIVGWQGRKPRSENFNIEIHADWLGNEVDDMPERRFDPFQISLEDIQELKTVHIPYWQDKTLTAVWKQQVPNPDKMFFCGVADCINYLSNPGSHFLPDYKVLMQIGYGGYAKLAEVSLAKLDDNNPDDIGKRDFYEGIIKVLEGVRIMANNYADKAQELAASETDPQRKTELLEISDVCRHVPWNPPRTFREAVQTAWFTQMLLNIEGAGPSMSYGRFDQYMYPFYQRDVEAGILTPEGAMEYLEELYIKTTNIPWFQPTQLAYYFGGYYKFPQLGVGGLTKDGRDASNEISYLCLRAMRHVRTTAPSVALYLHQKTPESLLIEACKLSAEGMGHPSFFNVDTYSRMLEYRTGGLNGKSPYTMEQILEGGCPIGCVEPGVMGLQYGHTDSAIVNLGAVVSLVMNNGVKPAGLPGWGAGEQVGPQTGDPREMKTYEDFKAAVKKQLEYHIKEVHAHMIVAEKIIAEQHQVPLFSVLAREVIEKGKDVSSGSAYCNVGPTIQALGLADMFNSMAAVKKCVYNEKTVTMDDLSNALEADFEGYEDLRLKLRNAPKYGNDDDFVDDIATEMFQFFSDTVRSLKCYRGNYSDPAVQMVQAHVGFGEMTWALPNGRLAMKPLADTMSAEQQTDVYGPTAAAKSYGKLNFPAFTNGTLLNMWISRSELVK
ncbi:MAG: pyruvate formate lyase family protein [Desulfitobacteriaceae bacterium]